MGARRAWWSNTATGWAGVNTELVESAFAAHGRRLVVLDDGEAGDGLVRDMVEVLTSFCARLYGRRFVRNRALKAVGCAQRDVGPQAVVGAHRHGAPQMDGKEGRDGEGG